MLDKKIETETAVVFGSREINTFFDGFEPPDDLMALMQATSIGAERPDRAPWGAPALTVSLGLG